MLLTNAEKLQHTTSSGSVWPEEEGGGGEEEEEEEEDTACATDTMEDCWVCKVSYPNIQQRLLKNLELI